MSFVALDAKTKGRLRAQQTLSVIAPSVGEYKELAKKLRSLYNSELRRYKRALINAAREYYQHVSIDSASIPPLEIYIRELTERQYRSSANKALKELSSMTVDSGEPPYYFSLKFAERAARWRIENTAQNAREISHWFCRKLVRNINHRMKRELKEAGISTSWLAHRWSIPTIGGQSVAPTVAAKIPDYVDAITGLITKMSSRSQQKVQEALVSGLINGLSVGSLEQAIGGLENMDAARALRVARDQTSKLNEFVQRENFKSIGVQKARWVHRPGRFTSRHTHKEILDGQEYDMSVGLFDPDPDVQAFIFPGELPYCRCVFRAVLPDYLTKES